MEPERCMEAEGGKPGRERPGHSERESIPRAYSSRNQEGTRHRPRNKRRQPQREPGREAQRETDPREGGRGQGGELRASQKHK